MNNSKMIKQRALLGVVLFLLGMCGVLSMLTMEIPLPEEVKTVLEEQFTAEQIKLLLLVNPTIIMIVSVIIGTVLYHKVNLRVPLIEKFLKISSVSIDKLNIVKYGLLGGLLSGISLRAISLLFSSLLPIEFLKLEESIQPTFVVRFLYGGFTEEIMLRFGLMTFIIWLISKVFKSLNSKTFWGGIIIAAIIFAIGHFPIVFQTIETPSFMLLTYILIGNSIGGVIFGWLYWKKGLEAAFIAHIITHLTMIFLESLIGL